MLHPGLYEQIINACISRELEALPDTRRSVATIDKAEASQVLAQYISEVAKICLDAIIDNGGILSDQVDLTNRIIAAIDTKKAIIDTKRAIIDPEKAIQDLTAYTVDSHAQQLLSIMDAHDTRLLQGKKASDMDRPETSMAHSSLFTGAVREPQMFSELKKEIASADRIDMLVSFIKWSGLRLLIGPLRTFTQHGGSLRVITTSYMGATDSKAVEELRKLPRTEIKISYDTKRTRLHAKTYVFYRDTGFSTAYIGSSNLSGAAMTSGLEWNVKVTAKDLPSTMAKIGATFDSYWNSSEFETYNEDAKGRLARALKAEHFPGEPDRDSPVFDIRPYTYQQEILDQLHAERVVHGHFRNLVVAATGTGKTVISAFDYKRFCMEHPGCANRFLYVAHREEILRQSLTTFRGILKDPNFGELYVGGSRPEDLDHLFISVQTLHAKALYDALPHDYYDYIVVDEFHHAAAPTYRRLLDVFRPVVLLGLTATPERMDGKSILDDFDGRIAAEIRLPEAIDRKLLCPFQYFGVSDTVDLDALRWVRGGYDNTELSNLYTVNQVIAKRRVDHIIGSLDRYVTDIGAVKGLGFCVSVAHAAFMAKQFNDHGIPSLCLSGASADEERRTAKKRLISGTLKFIFVVDLYNEGVDIPEINTILFLRPTQSLTIFLQQLGRGLRLAEGKDCLTVLDFIGQQNRRYDFEEKFAALLAHTAHSIKYEMQHDFLSAPKGCYIQLEKQAARAILANIKASFGMKAGLVQRIAAFAEDSGLPLSLSNFLAYYRLDAQTVYAKYSFSRLCVSAGVREEFTERAEEALTKAFSKLVAIDSRRFLRFLLGILPRLAGTDLTLLSPIERRMLQMFHITVWGKAADDWNSSEVQAHIRSLSESPVLSAELMELLRYRLDHIDFIDEAVDLGFPCPLDLHCTYTRDQLLIAMDWLTPGNVREGVKWLPDQKIDVLLITLNKSDKDYSPSTMYNDYSISDTLFHWQSQSTTSDTSPTGRRYMYHREQGSRVALFVRESKKDRAGAVPYTFLGTASYLTHTGSRPMNITWKLDRPIPARFLKKTNQLVAG